MLFLPKTVMKPTMLKLLKDLPLKTKSQLLKLNKEKPQENGQLCVNMTRTKMSLNKENAHLLPSETFQLMSKKNKKKYSQLNSVDDGYI